MSGGIGAGGATDFVSGVDAVAGASSDDAHVGSLAAASGDGMSTRGISGIEGTTTSGTGGMGGTGDAAMRAVVDSSVLGDVSAVGLSAGGTRALRRRVVTHGLFV